MSFVVEDLESEDDEVLQFREIGRIDIGQKIGDEELLKSNFVCVSNKHGFTVLGNSKYFLCINTSALIDLTKEGKNNSSAFQKVLVPSDDGRGLRQLKLSADELTVAACIGNKIAFYDLRTIVKGVCMHLQHFRAHTRTRQRQTHCCLLCMQRCTIRSTFTFHPRMVKLSHTPCLLFSR